MSQVPTSRRVFHHSSARPEEAAPASRTSPTRELPDVTGFLVVLLVTLGLFIVPVGATIMQGPAIVASLFSAR